MTRRILGSPTCSTCGLILLALLVVGGLSWVSVASLRVEESQRRSAAQAGDTNRERLALWRLDSHMLSPLGLENNRPYSHYSALHAPSAIVIDDSGSPTVDPGRVPSPLLGSDLPEWVTLHVQIDPNRGWSSPQVIPPQLAERLKTGPLELNLANCTPERAGRLDELRAAFPTSDILGKLSDQDRILPMDDSYIVPVPLADEPATEKSAPCPDIPSAAMRDSGESWLVSEAAKEHFGRFAGKLGGTGRPALYCDLGDGIAAKPDGKSGGPPSNEKSKKMESEEKRAPGLPADQLFPPLAQEPVPLPVAPKLRELTPAEVERDAPARVQAVRNAMNSRGGYDVGGGKANGIAPGATPGKPGDKETKQLKEIAPAPQAALALEQQTVQWIESLTKSIQNRANDDNYKTQDRKAEPKKDLAEPKPPAPGAPGRGRDLGKTAEPMKFAQSKTLASLASGFTNAELADAKPGPIVAPVAVHIGPMRARWIADGTGAQHLFLMRSVKLGARIVYQGVVVDWPKLQKELKGELADLFPAAELHPATETDEPAHERTMTALPVRLDPNLDTAPVLDGWSPLRSGLVIAWTAAILAIVAVALGGRAILQMSERRIRFASAVTHELRTPLTAMQLHLDLLNSGLVEDEAKKSEFLATICSEAQRLNQLVENVLDFARLEKRSVRAQAQPIAVAAVTDTVRRTWEERLGGEGFELIAESSVAPGSEVRIDPRVLEQVLGNLIDNARKYSKSATDRRIWLRTVPGAAGRIAFEVEDRGPGVPDAERRSIFQPFRRGSSSTDTGGAGLGLSLAKQWVELFGGTLSYRPAEGGAGACFRLELAAG